MTKSSRPPGGKIGLLFVFLTVVSLAGLVSGGRPDVQRAFPPRDGCAADVSHPLEVQVVPQGPIVPGGLVTVSVEIESRIPLNGVTVRLAPPAEVKLLSTPRAVLGTMAAGNQRRQMFTLIAPPGPERKTVDVVVEGMADGIPVSRGAVLNLVFEPEPSRIVTAADGRTIREVRARKVDR